MPAIELHDVTKEYGDVTAVDDLQLEVEEGEVYGFLGPNGAGKSTSINMMLDFIRPTRGDLSILGMDPQEDSLAIRQRSGLLPEGFSLYERLNARQHLDFVIEAKGAATDPDEMLERVGLTHAADRRAGGYSKGMQQRLALAMALVGQPDLIIFDEPATGLDPNGANEVLDIIREENERGATVFFSSHILGQIEAVCDRVGIMNGGRLLAEGSISELRETLGMERTVKISVDTVIDGGVERIRRLDDVAEVATRNGHITVTASRGIETRLISILQDEGVRVNEFQTQQGSLRDLFAAYTKGDRPEETVGSVTDDEAEVPA